MLSILKSSTESMLVCYEDVKVLKIKEHEGHYFIKLEFIKGNTDYLSVTDYDEGLEIIRTISNKNELFMLYGDKDDEALNINTISSIKIVGNQILVTFEDNNTSACITKRTEKEIIDNIIKK